MTKAPLASDVTRRSPAALEKLPPFPAIAMKVMQLLRSDEVRLKDLSDLIRADPSLSARVLRLANSPLFGFNAEIKGILQAAALLGAQRIKALAFAAGMQTYLERPLKISSLRDCWRHSLASAVIAERLGHVSLVEEGFAYTAGLLHDLGRLALMAAQPFRYATLVEAAREAPIDVLAKEREWFGIDHCEAGRWLLENWKLPHVFAVVAALHHAPPKDDKFDIVALVRASCRMADAVGFAAVAPPAPVSVDEVLGSLPEREGKRFPPYLDRIIVDLPVTISSLE
ncbi:MAG: HDOD domain-containing protein [Terriglobia bacterium]